MPQRVNYDQIAERYDTQPYRRKTVDADLLAFIAECERQKLNNLSVLDIGCGTGNQLVANRAEMPSLRMVGLDLFRGMLCQAQRKTTHVSWAQGNAADLPLKSHSFDFITNQLSFHHVQDKPSMIAEVFRVLRSGGRFVMTTLEPREMLNWIYYRYFPAALERDLQDCPPKEAIRDLMIEVGFDNVKMDLNIYKSEENLRDFAALVQRRDVCSQLIALSDEDYEAGLQQAGMELNRAGSEAVLIQTQVCLVKISGEKHTA